MNKNNKKGEALKSLLSQNIRRFRELSGYSQEELAEKAGISLPFLGAIERGEKWPSPSTLAGIAHGLDINPYNLMMPENTVSQDIKNITDKLVKEINTVIKKSVKAINTAAGHDNSKKAE
jgi:transcriptional regulator with XRE-family HTH domain